MNHIKHNKISSTIFTRKPLALAVGLACTSLLVLPTIVNAAPKTIAETQSTNIKSYSIPAGPLNSVLTHFSEISGHFIAGSSKLAKGKVSTGIQGNYSVTDALVRILAGTNLSAKKQSGGSYTLISNMPTNTIATLDPLILEEENSRREPGNMQIDSSLLSQKQSSSIEQIFSNESSVAVGGSSAAAQKIYVRGFEDVMLNVTIDGAQSPGELYHHQARVQLEPEFIKTIELDAGAGPATNGSGALTGALNVTLKNADDLLEPNRDWGAQVKGTGTFNGDNGQKYSALVYGHISDNVGVVAGTTHESRDNYEDGNGDTVESTTYDRTRNFVKVNSSIDEHIFSLTLEDVSDEAVTYERPNLVNYAGGFLDSDQEMNRQTAALNYEYNPSSDLVNIKSTVYWNNTDFKIQRQSSDLIYGEGDFTSIGFDIRNTSLVNDHSITYGIDHRKDELESAQNATPPFAWGDTEQSASVIGLYLQDNWLINDTVNLTAGLRYDDYNFDGDSGVSAGINISDAGLSPNIGINWEVVEGLILTTTYAKAFRGVVIREAFFSGLYVHDGELTSEEADNTEFGISYEKNGFFARATVYQQNIKNFIDAEYDGGDAWGYWENIGDAKVKGYELEAGFNIDKMNASIGVWNAENTLNDEPLTDGNMGLGTSIGRTWLAKFDYQAEQWMAGVSARYVESEKNTISDDAPDKKSYFITNVYANWEPVKNLRFSLAMNNLFNEFYYDHATYTYIGGSTSDYVGYPAIGREIVTSLSYKF